MGYSLDSQPSPGIAHQILPICRCDRWRVYRRLKELDIPCDCPDDGSLRVCVEHPLAIAQVRSVMAQTTASRCQLVEWLERCLVLGR